MINKKPIQIPSKNCFFAIQVLHRPIKKVEPKTNSSTKISNEETYDDSSKNLANFFNGEIIDLDE